MGDDDSDMQLEAVEIQAFDALGLTSGGPTAEKLESFFGLVRTLNRAKWSRALETCLFSHWLNPSTRAAPLYANAFLNTKNWESWPLSILPLSQHNDPHSKRLFPLVMNVFAMVHYQHFMTTKQKFSRESKDALPINRSLSGVLNGSLNALDDHAGWHEEIVDIGRTLYTAIVHKVSHHAHEFKHQMLSVCWRNTFEILFGIESFLFYRPARGRNEPLPKERQCGIHVSDEGHLPDLPMLDLVIDLLTTKLKVITLGSIPLTNDSAEKSVQKETAQAQKKWCKHGTAWVEFFRAVVGFYRDVSDGKADEPTIVCSPLALSFRSAFFVRCSYLC